MHYSHSDVQVRSPPPLLGQHTREVLSSVLGYDDAKVNAYLDKKVVFEYKQKK